METASILLLGRGIAVTPLPQLYFGNVQTSEAGLVACKKLGYASAEEFEAEAPGAFDAVAQEMVAALVAAADNFVHGDVLITSHAGYISFGASFGTAYF